MGCIEDRENNKDKIRTVHVSFKENTNISYAHYLEEKYNITMIDGAGASITQEPNEPLISCLFQVEGNVVYNIIDDLKNEQKVESVDFADIKG